MVAGLGGGTAAPKIGLLRREGAPIPVWGRGEEWQQQNREGVWGLEDMCNGGPARGWGRTKRGRGKWMEGHGCAGRQQKSGAFFLLLP